VSNIDAGAKDKDKEVPISIDGETYIAPEKEMTADAILRLAGIDPAENYLVQKERRKQTSYKDKGSTVIKLHKGDEFISVPTGDATVS
jgi:hypothetical protein